MMNGQVTPEQIIEVTQGATPVQIATLVLLGVVAMGVIIGVVKWVIDLKLGTIPNDLTGIRESLASIKGDIGRLEGKLWDEGQIQREIKAAIADHMEKCPFHKHDGDTK